jgi:sigma-E factor negative regulatory protein RseA
LSEQKKMNSPVSKAERLSALMDDETSAFEGRRLIDELIQSDTDRRQWSHYHLIGDSLRGGLTQIAPKDFLAGVQRGIAADELLEPPSRRRSPVAWLKPVAGMGVAAAVAMVTLMGLQMVLGGGDSGQTPMVEALPAPLVAETAPAADPHERAPDPRFARYLENHAELATPGSSAFARVRNSVDGVPMNGE